MGTPILLLDREKQSTWDEPPVIKRQLTPVERLKYFGEVDEMNNREPKITAEELLNVCREQGTDNEARKHIGKTYGLTTSTIECYINKWKIKDILKAEQTAPNAVVKSEEPAPIEEVKEQEPEEQKPSAEDWETFWNEEEGKATVAELRVLTPMHIGMKGDVLSYLMLQEKITIYNDEKVVGNFSIANTEKIIQELQAAIEIHNNLFVGGVAR